MGYDCSMILDEIQKKREIMIETAKRKGFTNDDTVRYSQELDQLIYEYQCHSKRPRKKQDEIRMGITQIMWTLPSVHLIVQ